MSCNPCGSTPLSLGCGWLKRLHPQRLKIRLPIVPHAWPDASRHLLAVRDLLSKIMYRDTSWAIFKALILSVILRLYSLFSSLLSSILSLIT